MPELIAGLVAAGACAAIYLYNGNRMTSRWVTEDNPFLEDSIRPQAGLYLGVIASGLAVFFLVILFIRFRRSGTLISPAGVPQRTTVATGVAVCALSLAFLPAAYGLTVVAAVAAIVLGVLERRTVHDHADVGRLTTLVFAVGSIALIGGGVVAATNTSDDTASCEDVFADGVRTKHSWADDSVVCEEDGGDSTLVLTVEGICFEDGEEAPLYNDFGWGYAGEPWHAGEEQPDC